MSPFDRVSQLGLPTEFPTFFPLQLEQYRQSIAEGADAPDEFSVAFMLAAAAAAAGADVSACVQPGWYVKCNMFLAVVGHKGSGKSTLADKCFAPLIHREEELRDAMTRPTPVCGADKCDGDDGDEGGYDDGYGDEEPGETDDVCHDGPRRRDDSEQPDPCLVINDVTGPALLRLLENNRRQLLVNTDELAGQFARNNGGSDRAMLCELFDGRRRRRERATTKAGSATLSAPYVTMIGSIQPALLKVLHNPRGDDGLLDRVLLVGDGVMREAGWPRDADDPILNMAWAMAMSRMLRIEEYAADAIGRQVESRFTPAALDVCKGLLARLNDLVVVIGIPDAQRGIVKKLVQHAVKLALLHRCLRWAAGEFGERGPLGDVGTEDASAACEATLFFLGRWLIWRKELRGGEASAGGSPFGLAGEAGGDPALHSLTGTAASALSGIRLIERLIRYARLHGGNLPTLGTLAKVDQFSDRGVDELRAACEWIVANGHGEWCRKESDRLRLSHGGTSGQTRQRVAPAQAGDLL